MALSQPALDAAGTEALDDFLTKTVEGRVVPAVFTGVTTNQKEIYFNCAGEKVFGKTDEGHVAPETSCALSSYVILQIDRHAIALQLFSTTKLVTSASVQRLTYTKAKYLYFYRLHACSKSTRASYPSMTP